MQTGFWLAETQASSKSWTKLAARPIPRYSADRIDGFATAFDSGGSIEGNRPQH